MGDRRRRPRRPAHDGRLLAPALDRTVNEPLEEPARVVGPDTGWARLKDEVEEFLARLEAPVEAVPAAAG